ncbi:MAG: hypothetical protein KIC51_03735 [Acetobacter sp.]|nr:hypothetical protein [Acetobacter sp.]
MAGTFDVALAGDMVRAADMVRAVDMVRAGGAARWGRAARCGRAAAEMWEKCGEKLDRRRAGAYIPGINAMAGGAGGCGGAYGARATGHGRRRCSGRNVHGRGSRSDDILDF